jgi:cytochrome c oxidase subunit 1
MLIAIPTGIKIFSWVATLWRGVLQMNTSMLFALGFVWTFLIGGLSGVMVASVPFDISISNTYFIVAHIHYVLFGGSVMIVFAGIYFWYPKVTGRFMDERLGRWHFYTTFICFNLTFFPMHYLGIQGMPRRVADYAQRFENLNMFITLAAFGLGAAMLIFVYNAIYSWHNGKPAGSNPWRALTLEWQVSSPPPIFNFPTQPRVVGGPYRFGEPNARHAVIPDIDPATVEAVEAAN